MPASPERHLCLAVIHLAVQDARAGDAVALAWLASKDAILWLDNLDLEQGRFLADIAWPDLAQPILQSGVPAGLLPCIQTTLEALQ